MKFVTENDLRDLYKKAPFTTYDLDQDARITPGARQFLADRGINIFDHDFGNSNKEKTENTKLSTESPESINDWKKLKLQRKLKSIEALFLLTIEELLSGDVGLAERVMKLNKQFSCFKNAVKNKGTVDNLYCSECNGINENNFSDNLDDCFEITEFHIRLKKGRDILILHRLRCALQEIEPAVLELCTSSKEYEDVIGKVNQINNSLSQLICSVVGGEKCQKLW